jgi:hypothetical protein
MKKLTVIILAIISTVISLLFIFLSYFGLTRYVGCYFKNTYKLIEKYNKLPKGSENRVIISFTCTPNKVEKLKPFINSILDQTVKVDLIAFITTPETDNQKYNIPKYVKDIAILIPSGRKYGKGTKIIPMLLREKECGTIIIGLDENIIYGQDFIYTILEESNKHPKCILIDKKGSVMLLKTDHFDCDVINRENENFDNNWFLSKCKDSKRIEYTENYKIIGF